MCALAAGFLVFDLARRERGDVALARRAVWIMYLAPTAFVLVMGYAEATLMTATVVALLALRGRRWWIAAAAGVIAGLTRPVGRAARGAGAVRGVAMARRSRPARRSSPRLAAIVAPAVGAFAYLAWAEHLSGDFLYPLSVQQVSTSRGGWIDPFRGGVARRSAWQSTGAT